MDGIECTNSSLAIVRLALLSVLDVGVDGSINFQSCGSPDEDDEQRRLSSGGVAKVVVLDARVEAMQRDVIAGLFSTGRAPPPVEPVRFCLACL